MTVAIASNCTACGLCLVTCPSHALRPAPRRPQVDDARCTDCWACIEVCPVDAITAVPPNEARAAVAATAADGARP